MKQIFVLVHGDYDGTYVDKFEDPHKMCDRATEILKKNGEYGSGILFAGSMIQEFTFEPHEVVTKYRAVEVK